MLSSNEITHIDRADTATAVSNQAAVFVVHSLDKVSECVFHRICQAWNQALGRGSDPSTSKDNDDEDGSSFIIALSGGSLPSFLVDLPSYFAAAQMDPKWDKWHILLADERLVPYEDPDSNLKLLQEKLLHQLPMIPASHIHGIDYTLLSNISMMDIHDIAKDYQYRCLEPLWKQRIQQHNRICHTSLHTHESPVLFDCVLLGFGPDGHTCSLFPNHSLLQEQTKWVATLADSPKPPLKRITLTLPVLNHMSRCVIFVGVGASKQTIVKDSFSSICKVEPSWVDHSSWSEYIGTLVDINRTSYPCAMVRPQGINSSLSWILDEDAAALGLK